MTSTKLRGSMFSLLRSLQLFFVFFYSRTHCCGIGHCPTLRVLFWQAAIADHRTPGLPIDEDGQGHARSTNPKTVNHTHVPYKTSG